MTDNGTRRLTRTALTASALAVLTVAGHSASTGSLPAVPALLVTLAFAFVLTHAVSDRQRSLGWLVGYLLAAQALLHVLLAFTGGHVHGASVVPGTGMLVGHAGAGAAAALVLAYSDDLIDRWAALVSHALGSPDAPALVHGRTASTEATTGGDEATLLESLRHHVARRGPPSAISFA